MRAYILGNAPHLMAVCLGGLAASYTTGGALSKADLAFCCGALAFFLAQAVSHLTRTGREDSDAN